MLSIARCRAVPSLLVLAVSALACTAGQAPQDGAAPVTGAAVPAADPAAPAPPSGATSAGDAAAPSAATDSVDADTYFRMPVAELELTDRKPPEADALAPPWYSQRELHAYAVLDGAGEAIVVARHPEEISWLNQSTDWLLSARVPAGEPLSGHLFIPLGETWGWGLVAMRFALDAQGADAVGSAQAFARDKARHAEALWSRGLPGAAWFRHEADGAWRASGASDSEIWLARGSAANIRTRRGGLQDSYELFSGNRALAENLALEREVTPDPAPGAATVELAGIEGITVQAMDWAPLLDATPPALDPLAAHLPGDQHALLFPSFDALVAVLDEADANGTPIVDQFEARSVDALTRPRLERQICLSLGTLARLLGPKLVKGVAITGSDFDLRLGSDVAVLLQSDDPGSLAALLRAQQQAALATTPGATASEGRTGDLAWSAVRSPDRALCSYLVRFDDVVLVTNSPAQLERIGAVRAGGVAALTAQPEYVFFRQRYVRGAPEESALLVITDETIRRLCGPRWRILQSRRTRALALLAEQAAAAIDVSLGRPAPPATPGAAVSGSEATATGGSAAAVPSAAGTPSVAGDEGLAAYGTLGFLTPIAELSATAVTPAEASSYARFREDYQRAWRQFFDPIAVRLSVSPAKLSADLTVMPLILDSDYRDFIELTGGAVIDPHDADRHADARMHLVLAVNPAASLFDWVRDELASAHEEQGGSAADPAADPLAWMGSSMGVWVDDDPVWQELESGSEAVDDFGDHPERLPAAIFIEVKDRAGAEVFAQSLRAALNGLWGSWDQEARTFQGMDYVRLTEVSGSPLDEYGFFYALMPDMLLFTPHEQLLQRALERGTLRTAGQPPVDATPWLGRSAHLHLTRAALEQAMSSWMFLSVDDSLLERCHANLPILDVWQRLFPGEDAVAVHQRLWHERLRCPGGGRYAWNETWRTMACSKCNHPGKPPARAPRPPALETLQSLDLGLTFELDGLRAQVELQRSPR